MGKGEGECGRWRLGGGLEKRLTFVDNPESHFLHHPAFVHKVRLENFGNRFSLRVVRLCHF